VAGALGACMMIIMGIVADGSGMDLSGMRMRVVKEMRSEPRRIASLTAVLHLPQRLSPEERLKLERAARTCPVLHSLHPDVSADPQFLYDV
jgi:putative redox protein